MSYNLFALTADDYGPHPFINEGTLDAVQKGLVTSVGVMANNYDNYNFDLEIDRLIDAIGDKNIGIGVHLSLTSGSPLVYSDDLLLKDSQFNLGEEIKLRASDAHLHAIRNELSAQIIRLKRALDKYGKSIDHISSHQGFISLFTPYHQALMDVVRANQIKTTLRNPLPISKDYSCRTHFRVSQMKNEGRMIALCSVPENIFMAKTIKEGISETALRRKRQQAISAPYDLNSPEYFIDNFYKQATADMIAYIVKYYPKHMVRNRAEMVVHLGKGNQDHIQIHGINGNYFSGRLKELDVLKEIDLTRLFHHYNVIPKRMGEMI